MTATPCLGVAGADGEARGNGGGRRRSRELSRVRSRSRKTGAGDGERERGQLRVDEVHKTSRGLVERRSLARHGASAMAHSEGEGREREADSGGPLSDI